MKNFIFIFTIFAPTSVFAHNTSGAIGLIQYIILIAGFILAIVIGIRENRKARKNKVGK